MVESAGGRRWGPGAPLAVTGGRDLLPVALAVAAAVVSLPRGFDAPLTRDLGLYAYGGVAVADGVPPYVGVFNRAGPLAHVFPAVGVVAARVVGADEVLGIRVFFLVLSIVSVPVAYWLARDVFGSRSAGVAAGVALATFPAFTAFATGGPREKTPMLLFMLLALWALAHRRWFLTGILIGVATLVLQIALFPLLPPAVLGAWWLADRHGRLRALVAIGAGGATTLVVAVGGYALGGHLRAFLDGFLLANARYTEGRGLLARAGHVATRLWEGYGAFLLVLLGGLLLLLAVAVALLVSPDRRAPGARFVVAAAAGGVVGALWCARDFDSWPDSYPLVPFALLGVGAGTWLLQARGGRRLAVAWTATWTVVALVATTGYSLVRRDDALQEQRASVAAVLSVLPDARIASVEAPTALVLAGRRNPTRHQMVSTGMNRYIHDTWPGGLRGFIRDVRTGPQQLVAVYPKRAARWDRILTPRYEAVGCAPGIHWYVDTGLPPDVRAELRSALAAVGDTASCNAAG